MEHTFTKNVLCFFFFPFLKRIRSVTTIFVKSLLDCQVSKRNRNAGIYALTFVHFSRVRKFPYTQLIKFGKDQSGVEQSDLQILTNARDCQGSYSIIPSSFSHKSHSGKYLMPHWHGFKWFRCCKGIQRLLFLFPWGSCHSFPLFGRGLLPKKIAQSLQLLSF